MIEDKLVTSKELCQIMRISRSTLEKWLKNDTLGIPTIKLGPKIRRYKMSDVRNRLDAELGGDPDVVS